MSLKTADSQKLVLLIDDEASIRDAVTDILQLENIAVITAVNGAMGIQIYQQHKEAIKVVLLDLSMPGLSGEETLAELWKINPNIPIVLSSGYVEQDLLELIERNRNVELLQKPYNLTSLLKVVSKYVGNDFETFPMNEKKSI